VAEEADEADEVPRWMRRVGLVFGVVVTLAAIALLIDSGFRTAQAFGYTGRAGDLTVTSCDKYYASGTNRGISYECRGDFVSSDGTFTAPNRKLEGTDQFRPEGTRVAARYARGQVRQVGAGGAVAPVALLFIGTCVALAGAGVVRACSSWRPRRRKSRPDDARLA
jgi:hypothetical protein